MMRYFRNAVSLTCRIFHGNMGDGYRCYDAQSLDFH